MPGQRKPGTRTRSFGCEDELWEAALETSGRVGTPISQVLRDALADFVASNALEGPTKYPHDFSGPASLAPAFLHEGASWSRDYRSVVVGLCPGCEAWQLDFSPNDALRVGLMPMKREVERAAWDHLEECPDLVALARQAGII